MHIYNRVQVHLPNMQIKSCNRLAWLANPTSNYEIHSSLKAWMHLWCFLFELLWTRFVREWSTGGKTSNIVYTYCLSSMCVGWGECFSSSSVTRASNTKDCIKVLSPAKRQKYYSNKKNFFFLVLTKVWIFFLLVDVKMHVGFPLKWRSWSQGHPFPSRFFSSR